MTGERMISFLDPELGMSMISRAPTADEVPVLDPSPLNEGGDLQPLAAMLRQACVTTGFFYVRNHGIPMPIFDGVIEATRRYFELPETQRLTHRMDSRFRRGFMPQGINQHPGYVPDIKESYEIGLDLPLDHPDVVAGLPLHGPNRWPAECEWLKNAAERYFDETTALGKRLLRVFAVSLDMPPDHFLQWCNNPMVQMRLFHYPPQESAVAPAGDEKAFGVAPHTDYGMITLLLQDPIGGLELRKRGGEWIGAPFIPGTLVVSLGDLFHRWTKDVYRSNPHRVVNRIGRERFSIPTFFNLDYPAPVSCLPSCQNVDNPPRHDPIRSGNYLLGRIRAVQKFCSVAA